MPNAAGYPIKAEAAAVWHDPGSLLRIEYARVAMETIRNRALRGDAVGGLLLGERAGAHVRILDSIELPCSHARGASFRLTPEERSKAREFVETARLQAVGWYVSRTGDEPGLTGEDLAGEDLEVYREMFPAQWQITLVLRVFDGGGISGIRAAFYSPTPTGVLAKGSEQVLPAFFSEPRASFSERPAGQRLTHPVATPLAAGDRDRGSVRSWIMMAVIALLLGAAAFEAQTLWQMHQAAAQAPSTPEVP